MELLKAYLKERRLTLAAFLLFVGVFAVSFALYGLPLAAVGYPARRVPSYVLRSTCMC